MHATAVARSELIGKLQQKHGEKAEAGARAVQKAEAAQAAREAEAEQRKQADRDKAAAAEQAAQQPLLPLHSHQPPQQRPSPQVRLPACP